jgi:hypothetical protein
VVLGVLADARRHLRAGKGRALCNTEEGAERIRDGGRLREDRLLLGGSLAALGDGRAAAALGVYLSLGTFRGGLKGGRGEAQRALAEGSPPCGQARQHRQHPWHQPQPDQVPYGWCVGGGCL